MRQERLKVLQEKFPSIDKNYKDVSKKLNEAQLQLNNYEEQVDSFNDELKEAFPGGYIPLGLERGKNIDQYFSWFEARRNRSAKDILKWKEEIDARRNA